MRTYETSDYLLSREKRALDLAVTSTVGILALAGGSVAAIGLVGANRTSPVFRQERRGLGGKKFSVIKLRSLATDGAFLTFGERIRDSGLDETPQFLNVLMGSMSVVGYRPLLQVDINHAAQRLRTHFLSDSPYHPDRWLSLRDQARPGITGPSQVMAPRPDAGSIDHLAAVVDNECTYLETANLTTDIYFIASTPAALTQGHNPTVLRADL